MGWILWIHARSIKWSLSSRLREDVCERQNAFPMARPYQSERSLRLIRAYVRIYGVAAAMQYFSYLDYQRGDQRYCEDGRNGDGLQDRTATLHIASMRPKRGNKPRRICPIKIVHSLCFPLDALGLAGSLPQARNGCSMLSIFVS